MQSFETLINQMAGTASQATQVQTLDAATQNAMSAPLHSQLFSPIKAIQEE